MWILLFLCDCSAPRMRLDDEFDCDFIGNWSG